MPSKFVREITNSLPSICREQTSQDWKLKTHTRFGARQICRTCRNCIKTLQICKKCRKNFRSLKKLRKLQEPAICQRCLPHAHRLQEGEQSSNLNHIYLSVIAALRQIYKPQRYQSDCVFRLYRHPDLLVFWTAGCIAPR